MEGKPKHILKVADTTVLGLCLYPFMLTPIKRLIFATGNNKQALDPAIESLQDSGYKVINYYQPPEGTEKAIRGVIGGTEIPSDLIIINGDDVYPGFDVIDIYKYHLMLRPKISRVVAQRSNEGSRIVPANEINIINSSTSLQRYFATGLALIDRQYLQETRSGILPGDVASVEYLTKRIVNVNTPQDLVLLSRGLNLLKKLFQ